MKKKIIALTMSMLMAASLSACGGGTSNAPSSDAGATTAADTTAAESNADAEDTTEAENAEGQDAAADTEGKVYKIATDTTFAPF